MIIFAIATGAPAFAQLSVSMDPIANARLRLDLNKAHGAVSASSIHVGVHDLIVGPIRVDGESQRQLSELPDSVRRPDRSGANEFVSVEIESIGDHAEAIIWTALDGNVHDFEIPIADNSRYYGGGERFSSLNHKGHILPMASIDRPEDKGSISYKPVPFFMSTRGYAVWLDSAAPSTFDFNATDREHVIIKCRANRIRLVLIEGPDFAAMLDEFTRLSGRPRIPPAWSFAPWKSRDVHRNRDEVLADAELTRKHDLPGSVIVIDSPWETCYNNFELNEQQFADPKAMFDRLRALGFYPCLWLTPFINIENNVDMHGIEAGPCSNYAEAKENGYLVKQPDGEPMIASWWKGRGALVDFTNPAAVTWWHEQLDKTKRWGVRAFKCDDGEGNFVQDAVFFDGSPAADMKNRYAALYLKAAQDYIDTRLDGDGVLFARSGFTGTQAQPFCWAGDNEANFSYENGLPSVVLAGQNAALSGLPMWGHDIAGYIGRPDKELFIRWTQFGAFSPLMQIHMTSNLGPWDFDEETLTIYRKFAKLHTSLFPYILDAAHEARASGMPIIRPMVLAFPNDHVAATKRYQYMFGPDLLIAPMIQSGTHRSVYLPKVQSDKSLAERSEMQVEASWFDYWTGKPYAGGQTIEVHAPLDRMPLFVRSGALICMLPDDIDTLIPRHDDMASSVRAIDDRRILTVWPGAPRTLTMHDGISVESTNENGTSTLRITSTSPREIELRRMWVEPARVNEGWNLNPNAGFASRVEQVGPDGVERSWNRSKN